VAGGRSHGRSRRRAPAGPCNDASFAVEALLEGGPLLERWAEWVREGRTRLVPPHFWAELANALLLGRQFEPGRAALTVAATARAGVETADRGVPGVIDALDLADRHRLTVYAALYLQLAADIDAELATLDRALGRAAATEGVEVTRIA
jgi:predicted nucleic acid-binding protein